MSPAANQITDKDKFITAKSLCETCTNAVPQACGFMRGENPESALKALGAEYLSQEMHDVHTTYGNANYQRKEKDDSTTLEVLVTNY